MQSGSDQELPILQQMNALLKQYIETREKSEAAETNHHVNTRETAFYRTLVDQAPHALFILEEDGEIRYCNPPVEDSLGYSPEELLGENISTLLHSEYRSFFSEKFSDILTNGSERSFRFLETKLNHRDGSTPVFEVEIKNLTADHQIRGVLLTAREITERNEVNQALLQSQKMESLGVIASGIAHDFRNILAVILGSAELLLMDPDREEYDRFMNMIISSVRRGNAITERILEFAQAREPTVQVLSGTDYLQKIQEIAEHSLPKNIAVRLESDMENDGIIADPGQLEQVLLNLCINASDAMPGGGEITLAIEEPDSDLVRKYNPRSEVEYLCFRVTDTGVGMDKETQERMFEPFFTTKEGGDGTGLGLATVYSIVRQHNGWVDVESQKGAGTTLRIGIPRAGKGRDGAHTTVNSSEDSQETTQTGTILLAEDEPELQELVTHLLTTKGYTVLSAAHGKEAVKLYHEHQEDIALILTDLKMPEMTGWELEKYIRDQDPSVKIVAITGSLGVGEEKRKSRKAFDRVVEKPFDVLELLSTVRSVLG